MIDRTYVTPTIRMRFLSTNITQIVRAFVKMARMRATYYIIVLTKNTKLYQFTAMTDALNESIKKCFKLKSSSCKRIEYLIANFHWTRPRALGPLLTYRQFFPSKFAIRDTQKRHTHIHTYVHSIITKILIIAYRIVGLRELTPSSLKGCFCSRLVG